MNNKKKRAQQSQGSLLNPVMKQPWSIIMIIWKRKPFVTIIDSFSALFYSKVK